MPSHFTAKANCISKDDKGIITVQPQGLNIVWGGDSKYWKINPQTGPAELVQVCWLEANGNIPVKEFLKGTEYELMFKLGLKADAFGWKDSPVYFMVRTGKRAGRKWKRYDLGSQKTTTPEEKIEAPKDGFKFKVPENADDNDVVSFGIYEVWRGTWKGGLTIFDVQIKPVVKA